MNWVMGVLLALCLGIVVGQLILYSSAKKTDPGSEKDMDDPD